MWLLTEEGRREGAYAVKGIANEKVLFLFEERDDPERSVLQLSVDEEVDMEGVEVDEEAAINACEVNNYKYTVISAKDFVIPPLQDDSVQKD